MPPNPYLKAIAGQSSAKAAGSPDKSAGKTAKPAKKTPANTKTGKDHGEQSGALRQGILALGGDEEDFRMLQDVESGSEMEEDDDVVSGKGKQAGGNSKDSGLLTDLRSFVKGLDFTAAGAQVPELDSAEEEADEVASGAGDATDASSGTEDIAKPTTVAASVPTKVAEKKESKTEREQRRKQEREAEKERIRAAKMHELPAKEDSVETGYLASASKAASPWIVEPVPQWYAIPLPTPVPSAPRPSAPVISTLLARGYALLERDNNLYSSSLDPKQARGSAPPPSTGLSKADQVFVQQILSSGTSSDKVSALLLLVSSSPLHTMSYLEQLASLSRKKSRDESGRALRGVVDWWRADGGGSPSRKLRAFADQPLLPTVALAIEALENKSKSARSAPMSKIELERCLALFAFEDWFKKWFFQVLQALEQMSVDPLAHPRNLAVLHLSNLLRDKPEQESNILRLLVNKLGDTQRGIASKTSHHLLQVLQTHPGMTPILVREVASLVLRPRATSGPAVSGGSHVRFGAESDKKKSAAVNTQDQGRDNARYYGIITLNQVMLNKDQGDVAGKMIDVYFEVFGDVLGRLPEKSDDNSDDDADEREAKTKKVQNQKRKRGEKQAGEAPQPASVGEADSKLIAAVLTGINRAFPFAKIDDDAFKQRLDTLFRITHSGTFNVSIQALLLIYHVSAAKRAISDRFYRALYASLFDPRLVSSSKQALYLNLVFRATKHDKDPKRVAAIVKRLIQILSTMDVTFTLGALYVIGELMSTVPGLREMIAEPESAKSKTAVPSDKTEDTPAKVWPTAYDGKKREPEFANAQNSCLWELAPLRTHWHPTVALYAESLLTFSPLPVANDLEQHSLNTFLDRFIYREPKKSVTSKGSSMMQSGLAGQDRSGRVVLVKGSAAKKGEEAVNSEKFRRKNVYDVPADQLFFHKYFTMRTSLDSEKSKATSKRKSRRGGDGDSSDSEESIADAGIAETGDNFDEDALAAAMEEEVGTGSPAEDSDDDEMEAEIWKAMRKSMPREAGDPDLADDGSDGEIDVDGDDDEDLAAYDYSDSDADEAQNEDAVPYKSPFDDEEEDEGDDDNVFLEEDDDLVDSDADIPLYGSDDDDDAEAQKGSKQAGGKQNKKRKLKHLPLFATADDYAKMLGGSDDEDI